jgi:hypothetical protein
MNEHQKINIWHTYINYLHNWAINHNSSSYFGMTPSSFEEWLSWEFQENEESEVY